MAKLAREHNNANVICLGERLQTFEEVQTIINTFFSTSFSRGERHIKRIAMLDHE